MDETPQHPGDERFCSSCGHEHGGGVRFCPNCGAAREAPVAPAPYQLQQRAAQYGVARRTVWRGVLHGFGACIVIIFLVVIGALNNM